MHEDQWHEQELMMQFEIEKKSVTIVFIRYWNVNKFIEFLLKHKPFASNLIFASVRQYNDNDERVYTKLETCNWWWKKQNLLLENVTIVFLLLTTNKTIMTQHHENVIAWSIYMSIDNLKISVRQTQIQLVNVLLEFISTISVLDISNFKFKIWHQSLSCMLKRVCFLISTRTLLIHDNH